MKIAPEYSGVIFHCADSQSNESLPRYFYSIVEGLVIYVFTEIILRLRLYA